MGGRRTNLALLFLLGIVFVTGWLAFSFYAWPSRFALLVHSVGGLAVVALLPWKSMLARRSLLRRGPGAAVLSGLLGALLLVSLAFGLLHSAGWPDLWTTPGLSSIPVLRELTAMELHVGAAIALVPLVVWHLVARPLKPRATDLSRRVLLRTGLLLGASAAAIAVLPAARRRLTGSYQLESLPSTSWMFDPVPSLDPSGPSPGQNLVCAHSGHPRYPSVHLRDLTQLAVASPPVFFQDIVPFVTVCKPRAIQQRRVTTLADSSDWRTMTPQATGRRSAPSAPER